MNLQRGEVRPHEGSWARRSGVLLLLGSVYFVSGKLGLELAVVHPSVTLVWAPSGVALAACLIWGTWVWPAVLAAAFAVNVTLQGFVWTSLLIAVGNTLEPVLGAYLVTRFASGPRSFESVRDAASYTLFAAGVGPAVAATVGVTTLALGGLAGWADYGDIWVTWWAGERRGCTRRRPRHTVVDLPAVDALDAGEDRRSERDERGDGRGERRGVRRRPAARHAVLPD